MAIVVFDFTNFLRESTFLFFPHCARPIFNFYEERSIQFYAFLVQSYLHYSASYVNNPAQSCCKKFWLLGYS